MSPAFVVSLLGAESTGKTTLAGELGLALANRGRGVAVVGEALREFCDRHGRTPRQDEQSGLAAEQTRRIDEAAGAAQIVIADTTALMIAVYSDIVFGDTGLYAAAEADQRRCDLTLVTALDLPWLADGLQRDGPHVRGPVDDRVRAALARSGVAFETIAGRGPTRLEAALAAIDRAEAARA
ncbi:MAG: ATP-binding protein [Burkholderiales bacterium]|nr:ATP-binding protein [Burkholderiales bacterium]